MRLVYKFNNYDNNDTLLELCHYSKDLYNQALYYYKQCLDEKTHINYVLLERYMKTLTNLEGEINYRKLKAQVSQQIIKALDKSIKGYFESLKEYKIHPEKFKGIPKMPKFKKKDGYHQLIYTNQCVTIKDRNIYFSKDLYINIPQYDKYKSMIDDFQQIRVNPKKGYTEIEIVYNSYENRADVDYKKFSSIDLGVSNIVTLVSENEKPIIFSGGIIKSKNRYFNKEIARYKSLAETNNKKKSTKRINELYRKRDNQLIDIYHKLSKWIVRYLIDHKIGNLIIGYNDGWKDSTTMGDRNNQNFHEISYDKLINYLKYKCECCGIIVVKNEESYTSKCDSLSLEEICFHDVYSGKRIKRGLFRSSTNELINADVNGAINIMRKVTGDSYVKTKIISSGLLFNPIKVKNLYNIDINVYKYF